MSKNGIYILSHQKAVGRKKKKIDAEGSNLIATGSLPIEVTIDSQKGSYRLVGVFMEQVREQFGLCLNLLKNKMFKKTSHILYEFGVQIDLGHKTYDGPSIGLPLFLAIIAKLCQYDLLCKIGATGELTKSGRIAKIGLLKQKLENAVKSGITIVIIPQDNLVEAKELCKDNPKINKLRIICVDNVQNAALALYNISHYGIVDEIDD